jgi:ATP-dependent DNA ligase
VELHIFGRGGPTAIQCPSERRQHVALFYYIFDVMILAGKDVMNESLTVRRQLLRDRVL